MRDSCASRSFSESRTEVSARPHQLPACPARARQRRTTRCRVPSGSASRTLTLRALALALGLGLDSATESVAQDWKDVTETQSKLVLDMTGKQWSAHGIQRQSHGYRQFIEMGMWSTASGERATMTPGSSARSKPAAGPPPGDSPSNRHSPGAGASRGGASRRPSRRSEPRERLASPSSHPNPRARPPW